MAAWFSLLTSERHGHAVGLVAKPSAVPAHGLTSASNISHGASGCPLPLLPTRRIGRPPSTAEPFAPPPHRHTPDRSYEEHILPCDAWPECPPIRSPRRRTGTGPGKDVPAGALLPPLPAPARSPPARRRQVPRRRLHRGRPGGHLRVINWSAVPPNLTVIHDCIGAGEEICIDSRSHRVVWL